ncbi:MAG: TAT-variant-translocated molybdopterin oxidoreductase, partial [Bdellovibrionales bacterium]|nr:TAT-variant-translocated molybdopterin oxidoreductase [Bdellovibrionales bacterium]
MGEVQNENNSGSSKYWLSLDQWRNDPEFQKLAENEFQSSPMAESKEDGWARREFLKLMGASMALTSFGCVRRPAQKIVPYAKRPQEVSPGLANFYASSFVDGMEGFGIVVTTREGRPIKVEGNTDHPLNQGGMSARAHAHILSLYDPDRLTEPKENILNPKKTNKETVSVSYDVADKAIIEKLKNTKVALLTSSVKSPSVQALVSDFKNAFGVTHYIWNEQDYSVELAADKASFGSASSLARLRLDKAKYIVTIDADILGTYLSPTQQQADFAKGRRPGKDMNKLVAFESLMSLTGSNADERFRIKPSQQLDVVMGLIYQLVVKDGKSSFASQSRVKEILEPFSNAAARMGIEEVAFSQVA